jgi:dihydrofolate reductase
MGKVRVAAFGISLDGFSAGPDQGLDNPLGVRGPELMQWFFPTRTFQQMHGGSADGTTGVDDSFAVKGFENVGAWILGRNMFGPVRGPWPDDEWKGWWGDEPPYHVPVFVLTHHAREPLEMDGGTTFYFVTDGIESALKQAREAAGNNDVRIGGGANTVRQFLQAGLIDEMHLAMSPVLLGKGEKLLEGLDLVSLGFGQPKVVAGENATHFVIEKKTTT